MKKSLMQSLVLSLMVVSWAAFARAQAPIVLNTSAQRVTFTATPGGTQVAISMGGCSGSTCFLTGSASGGGSGLSGTYQLVTKGAVILTETATTAIDHIFNVTQANATLFKYANGATTYLSGKFNLLTLFQSPSVPGSNFNTNGTANLQITGGTLASLWTPNAVLHVDVHFNAAPALNGHPTDLLALFSPGACKTVNGKLHCLNDHELASGNVTATPEPASLLLVGSGLVLMGGLVRVRLRRPNQTIKSV